MTVGSYSLLTILKAVFDSDNHLFNIELYSRNIKVCASSKFLGRLPGEVLASTQ